MQHNDSSPERKNFLGYFPSEMKAANPYSKYLFGGALALFFFVSVFPDSSPDLKDPEWYLLGLGSALITLLIFVLLSMFLSWVVRGGRKIFTKTPVNRFDYLATISLVLSVLFALTKLDEVSGGGVAGIIRWVFWLFLLGFLAFWVTKVMRSKNATPVAVTDIESSFAPSVQMSKLPVSKMIMGGSIIALLSGLFWWYEVRPMQIRQECSWIERVDPAKPADPGLSAEEVERLNAEVLAESEEVQEDGVRGLIERFRLDISEPEYRERPATPYVPEKRYYAPATEREYELCLRHRGL